jgi:hypothetical protein
VVAITTIFYLDLQDLPLIERGHGADPRSSPLGVRRRRIRVYVGSRAWRPPRPPGREIGCEVFDCTLSSSGRPTEVLAAQRKVHGGRAAVRAPRLAGREAGRPAGPEAGRPGGRQARRPAGPEAGRPGSPEARRPGGREARRRGRGGVPRPPRRRCKVHGRWAAVPSATTRGPGGRESCRGGCRAARPRRHADAVAGPADAAVSALSVCLALLLIDRPRASSRDGRSARARPTPPRAS